MSDEEYEHMLDMRDLWLSRLMFGFIVGDREDRSFDEFLDEHPFGPSKEGEVT